MKVENLEKLREQIKRHEGYSPIPYKDSLGVLTVGWGHNLEAAGEAVPGSITLPTAEIYFESDFANAYHDCKHRFEWFESLDDVRQAVIVNMCFNLGIMRLMGFKKMIEALSNYMDTPDYTEAARQMLDSRWARQVGVRASELIFMMLTGEWV